MSIERFALNRKTTIVVLAVLFVITVAALLQVRKKSRLETDLDNYMPQNHPAFVFSNEAEDRFHIRDGVLLAIETTDGIYNQSTLKKIKEISSRLASMKEIEKDAVTSLYTADNIVGNDGSLEVKSFYKKVPKDSLSLAALRHTVRSNDMIAGKLVSADETTALIVAEIEDNQFSKEFYRELLALADEFSGPEKIHVAGRPIVEGSMALLAPKDMKRMVPVVIGVILLVLWLSLGSIRATTATMLVVLLSTVWTFGLMAVIGIPVYAVSTMIPVMLIAIGVADGIHLFHHLKHYQTSHPDATKAAALHNMIVEMWLPVVITSLTTAIGFLSLITSEVYPIKYFGLFTAFGVLCAMVLSLVLIPAFSVVFGVRKPRSNTAAAKKTDNNSVHWLIPFAQWSLKHPTIAMIITAAVVLFSLVGIQKVWINSSFLDNFEKKSPIVQTDAFVNSKFGGTSTINVILKSKNNDAFKKPEVLKLLAVMQGDILKTSRWVGNSLSIADYIRRMNMVMHADSAEYNIIPDEQDLIAQYLLLYEMSGDPENLWKVVNESYSMANLTLQLKSDNSKASNDAIAVIEKYSASFKEQGIMVAYAGSGYKALVFTGLILDGQIKSLFLSFLIIIVILALMFRNIPAGLVGTVPIALTALVSFGLMGWFNIALSTTTALISSIAMGIGIDYAVHFLERYRAQIRKNRTPDEAGLDTINQSGRAILDNALVVIFGFMVLLFSVFPPNRTLGALVSLNMFLCFVGTITIMYLLVRKTNLFKAHPSKGGSNETVSKKNR